MAALHPKSRHSSTRICNVRQQGALLAMRTTLDRFVDGIAADAWLKTHKRVRKQEDGVRL
jgi:hypothetical protein